MESLVGLCIIESLEEGKKPITLYEIRKRIFDKYMYKISWSTIQTHCYKLKCEGKLSTKETTNKVGTVKKLLWHIPITTTK